MKLIAVDDDDFAWLLGGPARPRDGLRIAPGGLDDDVATVHHVRALAQRALAVSGRTWSWMMVAGDEVVGLCGFHGPPSASGEVELGYNVSPSRRRRGYATAAVAALVECAKADPRISRMVANTDAGNAGSQRALERNGFARSEPGVDGEIHWERVLRGLA